MNRYDLLYGRANPYSINKASGLWEAPPGEFGLPRDEDYCAGLQADWRYGVKQRGYLNLLAEFSYVAGHLDELIFPTECEMLDPRTTEAVEWMRAEWEERRQYAEFLCRSWGVTLPEPFGMGLNRQLHLLKQEQGEGFLDENGLIAHPEYIRQEPMDKVEYIRYNQELYARGEIIDREVEYLRRRVLWGRQYPAPEREEELRRDIERLAMARAEQVFFDNYWYGCPAPKLPGEAVGLSEKGGV